MRWDSPIVLISAGTVAIHLILAVFIDAMVVFNPPEPVPPAPVIEMVEVEVEPPPKPPEPPPELPKLDLPPEPQEPVVPQKPQIARRQQPQVRSQPETQPPETPPVPGPPGGDDPPTVKLDDPTPGKGILPPPARGTGKGKGGTGGGTGGGSGSGAGTPPAAPPPVSVATIKNPAMPKGDYGYIDAGKDYPAAARQLGIEGKIRVKLVVDATGKVRSAVLLDSLGHGLDELAMTKAKLIEFEPAKDTDDKPVASVVVWTFNMALPK